MPWALVIFNDTATTEIYTLSLHDALPISRRGGRAALRAGVRRGVGGAHRQGRRLALRRRPLTRLAEAQVPRRAGDRKSTRLNSSHANISYAVFCLRIIKMLQLIPSPALYH